MQQCCKALRFLPPLVFLIPPALHDAQACASSHPCEHLQFLAQLAKKRTAEKKLAITVFSFPPDKGNVGTAAYLNVFGSIYRVLQARLSPARMDGVVCHFGVCRG
jgi:hypothetical protein